VKVNFIIRGIMQITRLTFLCQTHYGHLARMIRRCLDCKKQFSVKLGTIFTDSGIDFAKSLTAICLVENQYLRTCACSGRDDVIHTASPRLSCACRWNLRPTVRTSRLLVKSIYANVYG
jgi:hypothetical protein